MRGLRPPRAARPRFGFVAVVLIALVGVVVVWRVGLLGGDGSASKVLPTGGPPAGSTSPGHGRSPEASLGASGSPAASASPKPKPEPKPEKPKYDPTGHLETVRSQSKREGSGAPFYRYDVQVERGLPIDPEKFAEKVQRVLADKRSWGGEYQRVKGGGVDFTVVLTSPDLTDKLCAPLPTHGIYSCFQDGTSVLNWVRWSKGAAPYGKDLSRYQDYMINHEVGHALGHGHAECPGAGFQAPVMMQQTKGVSPCDPNPWPLSSER